MQDAGLKDAAT